MLLFGFKKLLLIAFLLVTSLLLMGKLTQMLISLDPTAHTLSTIIATILTINVTP